MLYAITRTSVAYVESSDAVDAEHQAQQQGDWLHMTLETEQVEELADIPDEHHHACVAGPVLRTVAQVLREERPQ